MVPYTGDLSIVEQAQISNWFANKVSGANSARHLWISRAPLAHAITLVIAHRHRTAISQHADFPTNGSPEEQQRFRLEQAWLYQGNGSSRNLVSALTVDIDKECLQDFEERLFERSKEAGVAGFYQWGLDRGDHQQKWDPYSGLPAHWNHGDLDVDEKDLEVCLRSLIIVSPNPKGLFRLGTQEGPNFTPEQQPLAASAPPVQSIHSKKRPRPRPVKRVSQSAKKRRFPEGLRGDEPHT